MTTHAFANPFQSSFNPFLAHEEPVQGDAVDASEAGEVSYALVQSGPAVSPEETESHLDTIEVKVRWGTQVLSLSHLGAEKGFVLGEGADFVVPGVEGRTSLVERRAGAACVLVPASASATVRQRGEHRREAAGGEEIALEDAMTVTVKMDPVTIEITTVRAGKRTPVGFLTALASGAAACIGLSFVGHAAIVASLAMFMPKMSNDDAESISRDQILTMQTMLNASAEREQEQLKQETAAAAEETGGGSKGGEPHKGESGAAGTTKPVTTQGHMAFKGADDHVRLSRSEELKLAAEVGMIGLLRSSAPASGPSSPWATDTQLGQDRDDKIGAMFGADPDDAMGYGLGLWGTGEGGGGKGKGIGIDGVGSTVGGGGGGPGKWGYGRGDKDGMGNGHGPGREGHVVKAPVLRAPPTIETNGRLPAEVIQRIVRQNFGRFRMCYEAGLRNNPGLNGRVVTKFVIGRDGAVAQASDAGSDMASQEVIGCIVRSFNTLSFPSPEGGIATVTYPIVLTPGE